MELRHLWKTREFCSTAGWELPLPPHGAGTGATGGHGPHPWGKAGRGHPGGGIREAGSGIRELGMGLAGLGEAQTDVNCPSREDEESQAGEASPETPRWGNQQDFHLE